MNILNVVLLRLAQLTEMYMVWKIKAFVCFQE